MPPILRAFALGVLASASAACYDNPGFTPQVGRFHYPIAGAIAPDGRHMYVVNSDFNLQYNGGTVQVIDLDLVRQQIVHGSVVPPPPYAGDGGVSGDAGVQPESAFMPAGASNVQIDPFATSAQLGPVPGRTDIQRLYVSVRGDGTLTWIDVGSGGASLDCAQPSGGGLCGASHRTGHDPTTSGPRMLTLPALPIQAGLIVEPGQNFISVVHQETPTSQMSLFYDDGSGPVLTYWFGNLNPDLDVLFQANPPGTTYSIDDAESRPYWYALSRDTPIVSHVRVFPSTSQSYLYAPEASVLAGLAGDVGLRDMVRDPCNPTRAYATARAGGTSGTAHSPDQLLRFDLTDPKNPIVDNQLVLPAGPSHLVAINPSGACDSHSLLYVVSYDARAVFVVDATLWQPIDQIRTQSGPNTLLADPCIGRHDAVCTDGPRDYLYLIDFAAMVIEVIDVDPASPTYHRAVFTVGDVEPTMVSL